MRNCICVNPRIARERINAALAQAPVTKRSARWPQWLC